MMTLTADVPTQSTTSLKIKPLPGMELFLHLQPPVRSLNILRQSLRDMGQLSPALVLESEGQLLLIDGYKRWKILSKLVNQPLKTAHLPQGETFNHAAAAFLASHRSEILQSFVARLSFIKVLFAGDVARNEIIEKFLVWLEMEPNEIILKRCERILNLPADILLFCHEKKFSMKQCLHLTTQKPELLRQVFAWKDQLALSASMIEEILDHINDIVRKQRKQTVGEFLAQEEIQTLVHSQRSPQERTKALRQHLKERRFPILCETNARIEKKYRSLDLPEHISLSWDRTLENQRLSLSANISPKTPLSQTLEVLSRQPLKQKVNELLDEL